jgi:hypothetical protein
MAQLCVLGPFSAQFLSEPMEIEPSWNLVTDYLAPKANLTYFCGGHETMRLVRWGWVVLDARFEVTQAGPWLAYADLILVADASAKSTLLTLYGGEAERIFICPNPKAVQTLVSQLLTQPASLPLADALVLEPETTQLETSGDALHLRLQTLTQQADVMARGYQVRSGLPLLGGAIAWVRRNLTAHLREPYLDPTLERQVRVNKNLMAIVAELLAQQAELEKRLALLEEKQQGNDDD